MSAKIRANFSLGIPVAEYDPYLLDAYVDNGAYEIIRSRTDPRCFIIGRTGVGKSATLKLLEHEFPEKVIRIAPENLAMTYITNLDVMPTLLRLGVHLEPFLKALWKHVFIIEILRHRYTIQNPEQKRNLIEQFMKRWHRDPGKIAALQYLSEFGDSFWCETDERVRQIANTFEQKFAASGGLTGTALAVTASSSGSIEQSSKSEVHAETVARYQSVVNQVQIPRLNKIVEIMNTEIIDAQHFTYIIIDDLDKGWIDEAFVNLLIRCLFQAVVDLKHVTNLKILVALRTNLFRQLNYGEIRKGEQEEKLFGLTYPLRWEIRDLRSLLEKRTAVASATMGIEPSLSLDQILPTTSGKRVEPMTYIFDRTLLRPRDAILFLNEYLSIVAGSDSVTMEDIYKAERQFSQERLIALRDEWKDPYLDIDKLFDQFKGLPFRFSRDELTEVLDKAALLEADPKFLGADWLEPLCVPIWEAGSGNHPWIQNYGELLRLLYNMAFIGIVRGKSVIYSLEEPDFSTAADKVWENAQFEVHPAFRQALNITHQ